MLKSDMIDQMIAVPDSLVATWIVPITYGSPTIGIRVLFMIVSRSVRHEVSETITASWLGSNTDFCRLNRCWFIEPPRLLISILDDLLEPLYHRVGGTILVVFRSRRGDAVGSSG